MEDRKTAGKQQVNWQTLMNIMVQNNPHAKVCVLNTCLYLCDLSLTRMGVHGLSPTSALVGIGVYQSQCRVRISKSKIKLVLSVQHHVFSSHVICTVSWPFKWRMVYQITLKEMRLSVQCFCPSFLLVSLFKSPKSTYLGTPTHNYAKKSWQVL